MIMTNLCPKEISTNEVVKDFRTKVVKIVKNFRIEANLKDFFSMIRLIVDLTNFDDDVKDELANSSDETNRFVKML